MEEIKDRLAHILRAKNLTATQFAEMMEIQPSNVSHLLNGRNKPSLDFLIKLKEVFPEYSFDWIIMGKKPITINEPNPVDFGNGNMIFEDVEDDTANEAESVDEIIDVRLHDNNNQIDNQVIGIEKNAIEKIIFVYSDKTFEIIKPK